MALTKHILGYPAVLALTLIGCGGGGGGGGDTPVLTDVPSNTVNPLDPSETSEYNYSHGSWVIKRHILVEAEPGSGPFKVAESSYINTAVVDTINLYRSDCEFYHHRPITQHMLSINGAATEYEAALEKELGETFTSNLNVLSDSSYEILFTGSQGSGAIVEIEKVSDIAQFQSGSATVAWDGLSTDSTALSDVCGFYEKYTYLNNDNSKEIFVFGIPYENTRLLVELAIRNFDLVPGEYDLRETDGIEIVVFKIEPIFSSDDTPTKSTLLYIDRNLINEGLLSIEKASPTRFVGEIYVDTLVDGVFQSNFDIEIP